MINDVRLGVTRRAVWSGVDELGGTRLMVEDDHSIIPLRYPTFVYDKSMSSLLYKFDHDYAACPAIMHITPQHRVFLSFSSHSFLLLP